MCAVCTYVSRKTTVNAWCIHLGIISIVDIVPVCRDNLSMRGLLEWVFTECACRPGLCLPLFLPSPLLSSLTPGHKASPHVLIVQEQPAKTAISRHRADGPIQKLSQCQYCRPTVLCLSPDWTPIGPQLSTDSLETGDDINCCCVSSMCVYKNDWWVSTREWFKWQTFTTTNGMWEGFFLFLFKYRF